jgi:hypothetical protein
MTSGDVPQSSDKVEQIVRFRDNDRFDRAAHQRR